MEVLDTTKTYPVFRALVSMAKPGEKVPLNYKVPLGEVLGLADSISPNFTFEAKLLSVGVTVLESNSPMTVYLQLSNYKFVDQILDLEPCYLFHENNYVGTVTDIVFVTQPELDSYED